MKFRVCDTPKAVDMHARAGRDLNHSRTIHEVNTKRMKNHHLSVLLSVVLPFLTFLCVFGGCSPLQNRYMTGRYSNGSRISMALEVIWSVAVDDRDRGGR